MPKRREFKPTDRVCQRHFDAVDIQTTWDHMINGKLVQMERAKAKLKPTAVPKLNLLCTRERTVGKRSRTTVTATTGAPLLEITLDLDEKSTYEEVVDRMEETVDDQQCIKDDLINDGDNDDENTESFLDLTETPDEEPLRDDESSHHLHHTSTTTASPPVNISPEVDASFELLYDDIYEVMLPDTMYGIHRDPDRSFIVFSKFDVGRMCATKVLHIDREHCACRSYIDGILFEELSGAELSVSTIDKMLGDLDVQMLCASVPNRVRNAREAGDMGPPSGRSKCHRFVVLEGEVCSGCADIN